MMAANKWQCLSDAKLATIMEIAQIKNKDGDTFKDLKPHIQKAIGYWIVRDRPTTVENIRKILAL